VKMIRIGGFRNPKNWFQNQTQRSMQNKEIKLKIGIESSFWNKKNRQHLKTIYWHT
jgi:hypothetical protein